MIVSHEHRFIFIKTRKTAGSSVEEFLLPHLGPRDSVAGADQIHVSGRFNPLPELIHRPRFARSTLKQAAKGRRFYEHIPAWRVRNRVGREIWRDYFTFCFERDPWDKLVSFYSWRTREETAPPDFDTWVRTNPNLSAWPLYTANDEVIVDFVGRYENLDDDLRSVLDRIGLDVPVELPRAKGGFRLEGDEVEFNPALDAWVADTFRREIELMGYQQPTRR